MANKIDQSLDDILKGRKPARGGRRARRTGPAGKSAPAPKAPVGGIKKATKPIKPVTKAVPAGGSGSAAGVHKVIVSRLPQDVDEKMIKEFFSSSVGKVNKVQLSYGPDGRSRGEATISFPRKDQAIAAAQQLNDVQIDKRPIKVEVILGADEVANQPIRTLKDRISATKPAAKPQPKPATAVKASGKTGKAGKAGKPRKERPARNARGKPKTEQELDADMADYFAGGPGEDANMANGNTAQAANNGDTGMDEIM